MNLPRHTPWGAPDGWTVHDERGVASVYTSSHGGILVTGAALREMPDALIDVGCEYSHGYNSRTERWYEEDCAAYAVIVAFPSLFPKVTPEAAMRGLTAWYPEAAAALVPTS